MNDELSITNFLLYFISAFREQKINYRCDKNLRCIKYTANSL